MQKKGQYILKDSPSFFELWKSRGLFVMFIKQQFALFYNRAVFGIAWMILNPLIYLGILVGIFFAVAGVRPNIEIPFVIAAFTGLIVWNFFSHFVTQGASLLKSYQGLISKIYFPRIYVLYSHIVNLFLEYMTGFIMLLIIIGVLHYPFHWSLLFIIPLFIYIVIVCSGIMMMTSLLSYQYKDFQFLVPFLMQIGFYISPIWFSTVALQNHHLFINLYYCNPVVGAVTLMRACVLGKLLPIYQHGLMVSIISGVLFFLVGLWYWKRKRDYLADIGI